MFNLLNLMQTGIITMGVATATPIRDSEKAPKMQLNDSSSINPNVNQYTQQLTQVNTTSQNYTYDSNWNIGTPPFVSALDTTYAGNFFDYEYLTNYSSTSSYLNITATKYETQFKMTGYEYNLVMLSNIETYEDYNIIWPYTTTTMLVMRIDTYNYNIGTQISINNKLDLFGGRSAEYTFYYEVNGRYYNKNVYITSENWDTYLQNQIGRFKAQQIRSSIEDINNNFYYTKEISNIALQDSQTEIDDITTLNLLPNTTNYVVIEYIPMIRGRYWDSNNYYTYQTNNDQIIPANANSNESQNPSITQTGYTITGTNVIPSGSYEVIDIPGIMWEILTMPFAFVSQAFNLTLFPGTPYQLNISNLFLSIIAVLVFIWLITFFLKMKG